MPLYEYRCESCAHQFEKLVKMSAMNDDMRCPACEQPRARRLISGIASGGNSKSGGGSCGAPSGFS